MIALKFFYLHFFFLTFLPSNTPEVAKKVSSCEFENMYMVSHELYRSEQPSRKGFEVIDSLRIETVLSLRNRVSDKSKAKRSGTTLKRVRVNSWKMSHNDIVESLRVIRDSEKPVLVHCLHGSDRTGAVVAAYRMVFQEWSKEDAIQEFLSAQYGYHQKWFPNILILLKELDIERLKGELNK